MGKCLNGCKDGKQQISWTRALRQKIIDCCKHHGREGRQGLLVEMQSIKKFVDLMLLDVVANIYCQIVVKNE